MTCPQHPERAEVPCHKCLEEFLNFLEGKFIHRSGELVMQGKDIEQERIICAYHSDSSDTVTNNWQCAFLRFPNTNTGAR